MNKKILLQIVGFLFLVIILSIAINVYLLKNNVSVAKYIFVDDEKVIMSTLAKQQLDEVYVPLPILEVPQCLAGEITVDGVRIDNAEQPIIIEQTANNVTFIECPAYIGSYRTLGTVHNHNNGNCDLSTKDLETYVSGMELGQEVIGLYCKGDYLFYILSRIGYEVEVY